MMSATINAHKTDSFFRQYFLGEALKNILFRLTVIFSAVIIIWCCMILISAIYTRYRRRKQMEKLLNSLQHLYDIEISLADKQSNYLKRNSQYHSTTTSIPSRKYYSDCRNPSQCEYHSLFWPSKNENSPHRREDNSNKIQTTVKTMTKRPFFSLNKLANTKKTNPQYFETDSLSDNELKYVYPVDPYSSEQKQEISNIIDNIPLVKPKVYRRQNAVSFPLNDDNDENETAKPLQNLHGFNTKSPLLFHPGSRSTSNVTLNSRLLQKNAIDKQQQNRSLSVISFARNLPPNKKWKWQRSLLDDQTMNTDSCITSSRQNLPLVMITDTNSPHTNIIELETFEDKYRLITDIENI